MAIFNHRDSDDDDLEVRTHGDYPNNLYFDIARACDNENSSVRVSRDAVLRLYSALGEWLYPVHTPEAPNRALIEELVAKAVKDQVSAILPLHFTPMATTPVPELCRGGYGCDTLGVHVAYGSGCGRPDPDPRDVGHAEEPGPQQCDEFVKPSTVLLDVHESCGRLWVLHQLDPSIKAVTPLRCQGCRGGNHPHVFKPCEQPGCECRETVPETEPEHGRLMANLPRRPKAAPKCLDCLHGWGEHTGGICWGMTPMQEREGETGCRCTRERPSAGAVSPLTGCPVCSHLHTEHDPNGCMRCECTQVRP